MDRRRPPIPPRPLPGRMGSSRWPKCRRRWPFAGRVRLPEGATPTTVTVTRDAAGRYFVSLLVEEELAPLPSVACAVGVDLGLTDVVTLSTGEKTGNERFFRQGGKAAGPVATASRPQAQGVQESRESPPQGGQTARPHC